jgi:hypothetical protein
MIQHISPFYGIIGQESLRFLMIYHSLSKYLDGKPHPPENPPIYS